MELQKITTEYSQTEDRIKLTGVAEGGRQVAIWLTLRLMQRLVPVLVKQLKVEEVVKPSSSPRSAARQSLVQSFAQQSARAALAPQQPVVQNEGTAVWLAQGVEVNVNASRVLMTFTCGNGKAAKIPMSNKVLRQWLGIVFDKYRAAEWPIDVWPEWVVRGQEVQGAPSQHALH